MKHKPRPWSEDAVKLIQHMHDYAIKVDMEDDAQFDEIVNLGINLLMWHTYDRVNKARGRLTEEDYEAFTECVVHAVDSLIKHAHFVYERATAHQEAAQ